MEMKITACSNFTSDKVSHLFFHHEPGSINQKVNTQEVLSAYSNMNVNKLNMNSSFCMNSTQELFSLHLDQLLENHMLTLVSAASLKCCTEMDSLVCLYFF